MKTILLRLLLVSVVLSVCSGCAREIRLYPIEKHDIRKMTAGKAYKPKVDGYFLSDFYIKEVMEAKVGK